MNLSATQPDLRAAQIEEVVRDLIPRVSQLSRLVFQHIHAEMSRTEGGILRTLSDGPRRVTELAELEGLAQPTTTTLINRLERQGWVARERDPDDGRVVLVSLTADGASALERFRSEYRAVLRNRVDAMRDDELEALASALAPLDALVSAVQQGEN
jgi:DNA-binding MarR family transcriptional regulator